MIRLEGITKEYKNSEYSIKALDNVSLEIADGEFLTIMGASGSGKSTLLNIIGCMDTMTSGTYFLNDTPIHESAQKVIEKTRKENISFIFQHFELMRNYSVYENVEVPLIAKNIKKSARKTIITEKLQLLGIEELKNKYPYQLSGGQQQRVAIARALAYNNNIILADEPTGALDSKNSYELMEILTEINKVGKTIIVVTHNKELTKYSSRTIHLSDGEVV